MLVHQNPGTCKDCSDFPAPHTFTYASATLSAWLNNRSARFFRRIDQWLTERGAMRVADRLLRVLAAALEAIGVTRYSDDVHKAISNRARLIWDEAERRGIVMQQILIFNQPTHVYRAQIGGSWEYFQEIPIPEPVNAPSSASSDDKLLFKHLMQFHDMPVARGVEVIRVADARAALHSLRTPVVVKPRVGSRSRHTTPLVSSASDVEKAFRSAKVLCRYVLIEEHFFGSHCRATVVNGRLEGFLQKHQPYLIGDAVHTVRELVEFKNAAKIDGVFDIVWGYENDAYLARQGLTLDSIPEKGVCVELSRYSGRQVGGDSREMPHEIHPRLRSYIERAASILKLSIVGFDLIIPDPEADPDTQKWGFLEANSLPFIEMHVSPRHGKPTNVACAVWDLWDKKEKSGAIISA